MLNLHNLSEALLSVGMNMCGIPTNSSILSINLTDFVDFCFPGHCLLDPLTKGRYVFYWGRGWVGRGILEFFCEKSRGPPTSWNGLMHDPSEIPKQKHLTLPPYLSKTKAT